MNVAIVGAGPAGLTAARQILTSAQAQVDVFESASGVGGLSKSLKLWNYNLDLGPHRFFSADPEINHLWRELCTDGYITVQRQTRILYNNRLFQYPLAPLDAFSKLGALESVLSILSFVHSHLKPSKQNSTFQDFAENRFGKRLFQTFFKGYTEKLWGLECSMLDSEFGKQRIQGFSLYEAIITAVGIHRRHKTLVNEFPYPKNGTGSFWEGVSRQIEASGASIFLKTKVEHISREAGKLCVSDSAGTSRLYDYLVSTMPLTHLVKSLPRVPRDILSCCDRLKFRNTILVYLLLDGTDIFPDQWIYVNSQELRCGRITNFNNWSDEIVGSAQTTVLCMEFWAQAEDVLWNQTDDELSQMAQQELEKLSFFKKTNCLDSKVIKIPKSYPIYKKGYKEDLQPVIEYLDQHWPEIFPIGRYGAFKYNNQDHSMKMGMLAAENIINGRVHNLWTVNADTRYQERKRLNG